MSKRKRRMYSDEFKRNALELAETSDKSITEIERELGITAGLLHKWRQRYQLNQEATEVEPSEVEQLRAELRRLRRENRVLSQERDILKKAISIFTQET